MDRDNSNMFQKHAYERLMNVLWTFIVTKFRAKNFLTLVRVHIINSQHIDIPWDNSLLIIVSLNLSYHVKKVKTWTSWTRPSGTTCHPKMPAKDVEIDRKNMLPKMCLRRLNSQNNQVTCCLKDVLATVK